MTTPTTPNLIRVSVSEAARFFGVNTRTVRRAITAGDLTYIVVRGRYKINLESLIRWSQTRPTVAAKRDKRGLGQYVEQWKIRNTLYSPNPKAMAADQDETKQETTNEIK